MVVSVVGDVTTDDVRKNAEKYFADVSDAPKPDPIDTVEPEQKAERRAILEDPGQPLVIIGWHMPQASDPRYAAYKALADVMGGGEHSRLHKVLVKETKTCAAVFAGTGVIGEKYPGLLVVFAVPAAGQDPMKVEQQVYDVLKEMETTKPITDEELQGHKTRVRAQKIAAAEQNQSLASQLSEAQTFYGDWREFFREQERIQSLTVAQIQDAMKTSLTKRNRTVGMIVTTQTAAAGGQ
jgi:predicted Zn-dependent peptidase